MHKNWKKSELIRIYYDLELIESQRSIKNSKKKTSEKHNI